MNWSAAVDAMQRGASVRRNSENRRQLISEIGGVPVYECGTEPIRLAHAWSSDCKPVRVFQGSFSKTLFMPEMEDAESSDWEIAE